jgi:hypothetical protein
LSRQAVRPYLVTKDEGGVFRVDIRTTRFNSQGYPLVSTERLGESFTTATQARSYLRENYRAVAADIATS